MDGFRKLTFDIKEELYKKMKKYCVDNDINIKDFVNNCIHKFLN